MHERSHWRSILAQPSPKSVLPTKQMCGACGSLGDFTPSSGPNYARVLCIFHERPLDISTHRGGNRFWVLFGSKPMAKTWRFRRFRASHEGKKARAAVRWFPGGGRAARTPRVRRPRRSCPRPCTPSRPSIELLAKRSATTTASPSGATFWLRMTFLLVHSAPTRWRRVSAQGCLPPIRNRSNYKVQAAPRRRASTSTIAPGRTRARSDDRTRAESGRAARIVRCSTGSGSGTTSQTLGRKLATCRCRRAARGRRDRFGSARTTRTRMKAVVRRESRDAALDPGPVRHQKRLAGSSPRGAAVARPAASATASRATRVSRAAENQPRDVLRAARRWTGDS